MRNHAINEAGNKNCKICRSCESLTAALDVGESLRQTLRSDVAVHDLGWGCEKGCCCEQE